MKFPPVFPLFVLSTALLSLKRHKSSLLHCMRLNSSTAKMASFYALENTLHHSVWNEQEQAQALFVLLGISSVGAFKYFMKCPSISKNGMFQNILDCCSLIQEYIIYLGSGGGNGCIWGLLTVMAGRAVRVLAPHLPRDEA